MDLMGRMQEFLSGKRLRLSDELAEKYGITRDEVEGVVSEFLEETYGPAARLAEVISRKDKPVVLFIGKESCPVCRRSRPELDKFLSSHDDLELVSFDYSEPEGPLYHALQKEEKGLLPLIAMIFKGYVAVVFTGECVHPEVYERYYASLRSGCSQNIYAL